MLSSQMEWNMKLNTLTVFYSIAASKWKKGQRFLFIHPIIS